MTESEEELKSLLMKVKEEREKASFSFRKLRSWHWVPSLHGKYLFRQADDTTLTVESEKELRRLLMKVKEEREKAGLKLNIQKTKTMASGPITSPSWADSPCFCSPYITSEFGKLEALTPFNCSQMKFRITEVL